MTSLTWVVLAATEPATASPTGPPQGLIILTFLVVLALLAFWRLALRLAVAAVLTAVVVGILLLGSHFPAARGDAPPPSRATSTPTTSTPGAPR